MVKGIKARRTKLRTMFYEDVRGFGLHSQIANDFFKDDVAILNNGGRVKRVMIPYNIPGSGMFAYTKNGNPVVSIVTLDGGIAISIAMDGAYQRYEELLGQGI